MDEISLSLSEGCIDSKTGNYVDSLTYNDVDADNLVVIKTGTDVNCYDVDTLYHYQESNKLKVPANPFDRQPLPDYAIKRVNRYRNSKEIDVTIYGLKGDDITIKVSRYTNNGAFIILIMTEAGKLRDMNSKIAFQHNIIVNDYDTSLYALGLNFEDKIAFDDISVSFEPFINPQDQQDAYNQLYGYIKGRETEPNTNNYTIYLYLNEIPHIYQQMIVENARQQLFDMFQPPQVLTADQRRNIEAMRERYKRETTGISLEELIDAVDRRDLDELNELLDSGVNPALEDNKLLIHASELGYIEIVERLLEDKRVDPLAKNSEALKRAIINNRPDVFKLLLKNLKVDLNDLKSSVETAARNSYYDIIKIYLDNIHSGKNRERFMALNISRKFWDNFFDTYYGIKLDENEDVNDKLMAPFTYYTISAVNAIINNYIKDSKNNNYEDVRDKLGKLLRTAVGRKLITAFGYLVKKGAPITDDGGLTLILAIRYFGPEILKVISSERLTYYMDDTNRSNELIRSISTNYFSRSQIREILDYIFKNDKGDMSKRSKVYIMTKNTYNRK